jgi:hypothetical protein
LRTRSFYARRFEIFPIPDVEIAPPGMLRLRTHNPDGPGIAMGYIVGPDERRARHPDADFVVFDGITKRYPVGFPLDEKVQVRKRGVTYEPTPR